MANNNVKIGVDIETRGAQQNTESLKESTKSLKQEYRELTEAIAKANLEGKNNTAEYQNMIKKAGELRDAMSDANQAINAAASDTSNLDAVLGAASAATGGFGAATAIMEIMGANTDDVSKAQKRLQQAIALVNSVQAISNALNKDSALMVKLNAVAHSLLSKQMNATAIATSAASGALKLFKAALVSTGVGALVVGLGFLVEKLTDFTSASKGANLAIGEFDSGVNDSIEKLERDRKHLLDTATGVEKLKNELKDIEGDIDDYKKKLSEATDETNKWGEAIELAIKLEKLGGSMGSWGTIRIGEYVEANIIEKQLKDEYGLSGFNILKEANEARDKALKTQEEYNKKVYALGNQKIKKEQEIAAKEKEDAEKNVALLAAEKEKEIRELQERERNKQNIEAEIRRQRRRNEEIELQSYSEDVFKYNAKRKEFAKKWLDEDLAVEEQRYKNQKASAKRLGLTEEQVNNLHQANVTALYLQYGLAIKQADDDLNAEKERLLQEAEELKQRLIQEAEEAKRLAKERREADINRELINMQNILEAYKGSIDSRKQLLKNQLYWEKQLELEAAEETGANKLLIEKKYKKLEEDLELQAANEHVEIAKNMTDSISSILNYAFEDNKGVQIATTIASTIANAAQTFGSVMATAPGGPAAKAAQAAAASAAVVASGIKAVSDLNKTDKNTKSFNGGATISVSDTSRSVRDTFITSKYSNVNTGRVETVLVVQDVEAAQMQANRVKVNSSI